MTPGVFRGTDAPDEYTVKRGDSLSSIASKMYNDPAKWRIIANENGLDDPRHLAIGMALNIPKAG